MIYEPMDLGANLSEMQELHDLQDAAIRSFERGGDEPTDLPVGLLWCCTDGTILTDVGTVLTEAMVRWNGSDWTLYSDPAQAQINAAGTVAFSANQPMGGFKLTGLAAGTANGDSVRFEQVMLVGGDNAMTGDLDLGGFKAINSGTATDPDDLVPLGQIEDLIPPFAAMHWTQNNRDALGNGKPVVTQDFASQPGTYTDVGRVPRELVLRITGQLIKQGGGGVAYPDFDEDEYVVRRWNADATGGDTGTDASVVVATINPLVGGLTLDIIVEWKYSTTGPDSNLGFYLRFVETASGDFYWVRNAGDTDEGSIQAMAFFGEGT